VTYTVTFDPNGGLIDGSTAVITTTVEEGGTATVPTDPTLSGYVFSGWSSSVSGKTVDSEVTEDITFTAQWTKSSSEDGTYTVVFDVNGGAEYYDAQTVTAGGTVTNPGTPTRSGYTFVGWYNGGAAWNFDTDTVSSNLTLIAWWKSNATGTISNGTGSGSGTGSTGSSHTLDSTPSTADGDLDPRFALCIAIFLTGIGMLVYSRHTKLQVLANHKKDR